MPVVIETIEPHGQSASGTLENRGSRLSPQLTFITGLVMRHPSMRDWNSPGTPSAATRPSVRRGSAFEITARARMSSPPSSTTPSPGRISATGTPAASTAPASRAASAIANDTMPMPPST